MKDSAVERFAAYLGSIGVISAVYVMPAATMSWGSSLGRIAKEAAIFFIIAYAVLWVCWSPLSRWIAYYHEEAHAFLLRRAGFEPTITFDYETHPWFGFKRVRGGQWSLAFEDIIQVSSWRYHAVTLAPLALALPPAVTLFYLGSTLSPFAGIGAYYGVLFGVGPSFPDLESAMNHYEEQPSVENLKSARDNHALAEGIR